MKKILHTGQHYDLDISDKFFDELEIPKPFLNLGIGGGSHGENTGRMIEQIEKVLFLEKPDAVMVYGDTDSTLAGAIATSKLNIPLIHIEVDLRSFNRKQPEEKIKILTDHLSEICFVPSKLSKDFLLQEGIENKRIVLSGDVMVDSVRIFGDLSDKKSYSFKEFNITKKEFHFSNYT